jgi:RHS repeat-associated protein
MSDQNAAETISVPQGGGALKGIGETFQPDLHTGTGNMTVPIPLPAGRGGLSPSLSLAYSSGNGNGPFGLGWSLAVPHVSRRTDRGIPIYDDDIDIFVLSGAEELVPVPLGNASPVGLPIGWVAVRYRPRTEAGFARIVHVSGDGNDYWDVSSRDGLTSRYGTAVPADAADGWTDPATIRRSDGAVFTWLLSHTTDSFGNHIAYSYVSDGGAQRYLDTISYVDYGDTADPSYAVTATVLYGPPDDPTAAPMPRPDSFSDRKPGFELRTNWRASQIAIQTPGAGRDPVTATTVDLTYADQTEGGAVASAASLLTGVTVSGHDPDADDPQSFPPLSFTYRDWDPEIRRYRSLSGLPPAKLGPGLDLVDLFTDGLPSVLQMNGTARYWRNRGDTQFELPRSMASTPTGAILGSAGVLLSDVDGDGRPELTIGAGGLTTVWSLTAGSGPVLQAGFDPRPRATTGDPSVGYTDPRVRLLDLDGDHITDLLLAGTPPWMATGDGNGGFTNLRPLPGTPPSAMTDLADPHVHLADLTGDGLTDVALVYNGTLTYWPNLGHGQFGDPVRMTNAPQFDDSTNYPGVGYDPGRLLLGDVTGDGTADAVYVADGAVTVWVNQSGNGFASPVVIRGTPRVASQTAVRLADIDGIGVSGVLWSGIGTAQTWAFLDLTGGAKPYLVTGVDNHHGATTSLTWSTSTAFAADDRTAGQPWSTTLPFPVHVVAQTQTVDAFSGTLLTSTFAYHNGYWDPADREFRGFGRVEQTDSLAPMIADTPKPAEAQLLDPLTPPSPLPAGFAPADHGNLLNNWSFDDPGAGPTTLTTTPEQPFGPGACAAPGWSVWNNVAATTTTEIKKSTLPQGQGGSMLHVTSSGAGCGVVQTFGESGTGPDRVVASVWLFIVQGRVAIGTGNGGDTIPDAYCDQIGQWVLVSAGNQRTPANEFIVYSVSDTGAEFYLDHAWIAAPNVPPSPVSGPPTRTVTWFHLGPVGPAEGGWTDIDSSSDYWQGDAPLLPYLDTTQLPNGIPRPAQREALRGLRGRVLRSETYAEDGDPVLGRRPYEVHDSVLRVVPVFDGRDPLSDPSWNANPVITPQEILTRSATWDRGADPMTRITGSAFDEYGRVTAAATVGVPRGRDPRGPGEACLASVTATEYATRDDALRYQINRVSAVTRHEANDPGTGPVTDFVAAAVAGAVNGDLRAVELSYYDGAAFTGLPLGQLGDHGLPVRTEHLVLTPERLHQIAAPAVPDGTTTPLPPYLTLDGSAPAITLWAGYPAAFQASVQQDAPAQRGTQLGYVWHSADGPYVEGYYARSTRLSYDVHTPIAGQPPRGLPLVACDSYGGETTTVWDSYALLPTQTTNPVGLTTAASYDYRLLKPARVTDANNNVTAIGYTPLGLTAWIARLGKQPGAEGDTIEQPSHIFSYDLTAYDESITTGATRQPISVTSVARVDHRWTLVDQENARRTQAGQPPLSVAEITAMFGPTEQTDHLERFIRTVEYTDGLGRLLQKRTQADELIVSDVGLPDDTSTAATTITATPAGADPYVTVGSWKRYDNKGRTIVTYEPFFDTGYAYNPPGDDQLATLAQAQQHYDPVGRPTVTVAPDGSQTQILYGTPSNPKDPTTVVPSPWETYTYAANDNAGRTHPTLSLDIVTNWDTPSSTLVDALGRTVQTVQRGLDTDAITSSAYDIDGHVISVTDPLNRLAAATVYDYTGKPWLTWLLDAGSTRSFRDAASGAVEHRDDKGSSTLAGFDLAHRATRLWAADHTDQNPTLREVSIYGDDLSNSGLTPAQAFSSNAYGRVVLSYDDAGRVTTREYDLDGNPLSTARQVLRPDLLISGIPQSGQWVNTSYQTDWEPGPNETLADHAANLLDPTSYQTDATFDALARRKSSTAPLDSTNNRAQITFGYGRSGGITSIAVDRVPYLQRVVYDAHGRRLVAYLGNAVLTRYLYDPRTLRLRRIQAAHSNFASSSWTSDGPALQDYNYRYDLTGNLLTLGDRTPGSGLPLGDDPVHSPNPDELNRVFSYDALDRLLTATGRETDIAPSDPWIDIPRSTDVTKTRPYTEAYTYDNAGNTGVLEHNTNPEGTGAYNRYFKLAEASNQLASLAIGRGPGAPTLPYSYDACGNMLTEATNRNFEWDYANRMSTFRDQAGPAKATVYSQYRYDGSSERVLKLVRNSAGPDELTLFLGGFERTLRGTVGGTLVPYDEIYLADGDDHLAIVKRGDSHPSDAFPDQRVTYQLEDLLSSVAATVSSDGNPLNREEYLPYGETSFGSYARKRYRYTACGRDAESGLNYHGARFYAPWLARWCSCDPAGLTDNLNLYCYVSARPTKQVDKSGLQGTNSIPDLFTFIHSQAGFQAGEQQGNAAFTLAGARENAGRSGVAAHQEASNVVAEMRSANIPGAENIYSEVAVSKSTGLVTQIGGSPIKGNDNLDLVAMEPGHAPLLPNRSTLQKAEASAVADLKYGRGKITAVQGSYGKQGLTVNGKLGKASSPSSFLETSETSFAGLLDETPSKVAPAIEASIPETKALAETLAPDLLKTVGVAGRKAIPFLGSAICFYSMKENYSHHEYQAAAWDALGIVPFEGTVSAVARILLEPSKAE